MVDFILGKDVSLAGSLSKSLGCASEAIPNSVCSSSASQVCSSSRQAKLSSGPARSYSSRPHPYCSQVVNGRSTSSRRRQKYCNLVELLQCQTVCLYKQQPFAGKQVSHDILQSDTDPVKPAFAFCSDMKRSTRADVEQIFNRTSSLPSDDDNTDTIYTADDVERFDERKELAKELDQMLGDDTIIMD